MAKSLAKVIEECQSAIAQGVPSTAEFKAGGQSLAAGDSDLVGANSKFHLNETDHYEVIGGNPAATTAMNFPVA